MPSSYLLELGQVAEVFVGLCVYTLAAILIHEAGHAAVGLLLGFEIGAVRVGPADLKKRNKWVWSLNKERWDRGFVMVQFRNLPGPLAGLRGFAFILGGPAANLCVALVLASFSSGSTLFGRGCGT